MYDFEAELTQMELSSNRLKFNAAMAKQARLQAHSIYAIETNYNLSLLAKANKYFIFDPAFTKIFPNPIWDVDSEPMGRVYSEERYYAGYATYINRSADMYGTYLSLSEICNETYKGPEDIGELHQDVKNIINSFAADLIKTSPFYYAGIPNGRSTDTDMSDAKLYEKLYDGILKTKGQKAAKAFVNLVEDMHTDSSPTSFLIGLDALCRNNWVYKEGLYPSSQEQSISMAISKLQVNNVDVENELSNLFKCALAYEHKDFPCDKPYVFIYFSGIAEFLSQHRELLRHVDALDAYLAETQSMEDDLLDFYENNKPNSP